jgi:hypothetical protein
VDEEHIITGAKRVVIRGIKRVVIRGVKRVYKKPKEDESNILLINLKKC